MTASAFFPFCSRLFGRRFSVVTVGLLLCLCCGGEQYAAATPALRKEIPSPSPRDTLAKLLEEKLLFTARMQEELCKAGFGPTADGDPWADRREQLADYFWLLSADAGSLRAAFAVLQDTKLSPEERMEKLDGQRYNSVRYLQSTTERLLEWVESDERKKSAAAREENFTSDPVAEEDEDKDASREERRSRAEERQIKELADRQARLRLILTFVLQNGFWMSDSPLSDRELRLLWPVREDARMLRAVREALSGENGRRMDRGAFIKKVLANPEGYKEEQRFAAQRDLFAAVDTIGRADAVRLPVGMFLPDAENALKKAGTRAFVPQAGAKDLAPGTLPEGVQPNGLVIRPVRLLESSQDGRIRQHDTSIREQFGERGPKTIPLQPGELFYAVARSLERRGSEPLPGSVALWRNTPLAPLGEEGPQLAPWDREQELFWMSVFWEQPHLHSFGIFVAASCPKEELAAHLAWLSVVSGRPEASLRGRVKDILGFEIPQVRRWLLGVSPDAPPPVDTGENTFRFANVPQGMLFLAMAQQADKTELARLFGPVRTMWIPWPTDRTYPWRELSLETPAGQGRALVLGKDPVPALPAETLSFVSARMEALIRDMSLDLTYRQEVEQELRRAVAWKGADPEFPGQLVKYLKNVFPPEGVVAPEALTNLYDTTTAICKEAGIASLDTRAQIFHGLGRWSGGDPELPQKVRALLVGADASLKPEARITAVWALLYPDK